MSIEIKNQVNRNKISVTVQFDPQTGTLTITEVVSPPDGKQDREDGLTTHLIPSKVVQAMFDNRASVDVSGSPDTMGSPRGNHTTIYSFKIEKEKS